MLDSAIIERCETFEASVECAGSGIYVDELPVLYTVDPETWEQWPGESIDRYRAVNLKGAKLGNLTINSDQFYAMVGKDEYARVERDIFDQENGR